MTFFSGSPSDPQGRTATKIFLWNTENWEWEASTKGSGTGMAVDVENFPAVICGSTVPISSNQEDVTSKYKISDMDDANGYFGYVDPDGKWYIMMLTDSTCRYAAGPSNYSTAWGNRGILDYDTFDKIF